MWWRRTWALRGRIADGESAKLGQPESSALRASVMGTRESRGRKKKAKSKWAEDGGDEQGREVALEAERGDGEEEGELEGDCGSFGR